MNWDEFPPELPDGWVFVIVATMFIIGEIIIVQWPRIAEYMGWTQ